MLLLQPMSRPIWERAGAHLHARQIPRPDNDIHGVCQISMLETCQGKKALRAIVDLVVARELGSATDTIVSIPSTSSISSMCWANVPSDESLWLSEADKE